MRRRPTTPSSVALSQSHSRRTLFLLTHNLPLLASFLLLLMLLMQFAARAQTVPGTVQGATAIPGNIPKPAHRGLKTAIVSATDTSGSLPLATRALAAANTAISRMPGYDVMAPRDVSSSIGRLNLKWPFTIMDYQALHKKLHIDRALTVTVSPTASGDNSIDYAATVEMYDTNTGGLVGHGEGRASATHEMTVSSAPATNVTPPVNADMTTTPTAAAPNTVAPKAPEVPATDWRWPALDRAVMAAVAAMEQPAQLQGIVISRPNPYQARLSLGELSGIRAGSRIEYLSNGVPIAYGSVIDLGAGESLATIAPESALPSIALNMPFRTANIPPLANAGPTSWQLDNKEWNRFERDFAISAAAAAAYYYLIIH